MYLPRLSQSSVQLLATAAEESSQAGHGYLGVEHLFLGLTEDPDSGLALALAAQGVEIPRLRSLLKQELPENTQRAWGEDLIYTPRCHEVLQLAGKIAANRRGSAVEPAHIQEAIFREGRSVPLRLLRTYGVDLIELQGSLSIEPEKKETSTPLLDRFGRDLTALARTGALSPVVGRTEEIDLVQQILLRKNKNNAVLVGDAGVGKTAVVEGFAQRIVAPDCPEPFRGWRIVEVSLPSLVAGTKLRGEFEERIMGIMNEAQEDNILLFLDEIHTLVGAGASSGDSLDASNILKPALARGELRTIGATTIAEYRRTIERDAALDRRFDKVMIEEPSRDETLEILHAVRTSLEHHHEVVIDSEALNIAVDLTVRHLPARKLPDKALDALDQTCARRRLRALQPSSGGATTETQVTARDVTRTISQWTGIPLERLTGEAAKGLLNLGSALRARVIGQDHAVEAVSRAILTARAGLASPHRPIGVFLFLGPTGVGKTELAKSLAELLYGDTKHLIRFDMSEYTEAHSAAKLIGAPPGYVGYEEEGLLIAAVRTRPHSVVLFDEVEKAHPQLFDLFLQIFDEGRLSSAHGQTADFTQSVVILTSNLNPTVEKKAALGFNAPAEPTAEENPDVRQALTGHFRPELLNRIDKILQFSKLSGTSLRHIIDQYIGEIEAQLAEREIELSLDDAVYDHLIRLGESDTFGARELRRVVDQQIRQSLATEVLRNVGTKKIRVGFNGEKIVFLTE